MAYVRCCNEKFSDSLACDIKSFVVKHKLSNQSEYCSILDSKVCVTACVSDMGRADSLEQDFAFISSHIE
jgi:hypothetical protein